MPKKLTTKQKETLVQVSVGLGIAATAGVFAYFGIKAASKLMFQNCEYHEEMINSIETALKNLGHFDEVIMELARMADQG